VPDPVAGTMWVSGKSIKFSRTPMVVGSAPTVGQHTREVLTELLGYSDQKAQALVDEEVVGVDE
jgi:crotonobetainyl-CoA:carnitine CoA-transferase CaiB-like acyl-CoA transferase